MKWAVLGGGNGGQAMAGHLGIVGFSVNLYDIFEEKINIIRRKSHIKIDGCIDGIGKLSCATTDIEEAIDGADVIMVVTPTNVHKDVAAKCAHCLKSEQIIVLNPGGTGGAIEFRNQLRQEGCKANVIIAEAETLLYVCRSEHPAQATIYGIKRQVGVGALPATSVNRVIKALNIAFPEFIPRENVLLSSFDNLNAMVHPSPALLNISRIDSGEDFLFYKEGITPIIGRFVESIDRERIDIGKALGLQLTTLEGMYKKFYGLEGKTIYDIIAKNVAYDRIAGPKEARPRYIFEDIATGLVPMVSFGNMLGTEVKRTETVVKMAEYIFEEEFSRNGRTVQSLGLAGMTVSEICRFVE